MAQKGKTMMKFISLAMATAIVFTSCTNGPESPEAKTTDAKQVENATANEKWNVDASASKVEWVGTKVSGYHTGEIPLRNGEILLRDGNVSGGKFVLDVANLTVSGPKGSDDAANKKLLGHLKSADFFDVQKHPEATFELTEVKPFSGETLKDTADDRQSEISEYTVVQPTHTISGNLTMKGVTKNIEFPAQITVNGGTVEAKAKFNINRKDWNIVYPGMPDDLIKDAVHIGLLIRASK